MTARPDSDKPNPQFICHARRHMDAEFRAYDYMVAACKSAKDKEGNPTWKPGDQLSFHGTRRRIANQINRSLEQVDAALATLEAAGWLVPTGNQGPRGARKQRRWFGRHSTVEYEVLEHEDYARTHDCPPLRYDEETSKAVKPGRMARPIERRRVRAIPDDSGLMASLPDALADGVADAIAAKKGVK
jgi:hypothetical protein